MRLGRLGTVISRCNQPCSLGGRAHLQAAISRQHVMTVSSSIDDKPCGVVAPAADTRTYKSIRLHNGVRWLLVHDPDCVFAAACANVQVGYMDDPLEVPGLAHFLEHACHLGSGKYPDEKDYKAHLAKHAGSSNASTAMAHTQYHFTVHAGACGDALDRLGRFFVDPLLTEESATREVENVHAEFSRNKNSDARKLLQLRRSSYQGAYSQFSTGNIDTLKHGPAAEGIHVATLLRQLWERHYTAGGLCGCVVAPQPLAEQEGWVTNSFGAVRPTVDGLGNGLPTVDPDAPPMPTSRYGDPSLVAAPGQEGLGRLFRVSPQREAMRSLELSWMVPRSSLEDYKCKPWRWASHLLGHEGPGSLAAALKAAGLITGLDASTGDELRLLPGFMFWGVTLQLTEAGVGRVGELLVAVHHALALVNALPDQQRKEIYDEAAQVSQLRWDWADRQQALDVAREAAARLHYYAPSELLTGPTLLHGYDGAAIDWFLTQLVPSRMNVVLTAQDAAGLTPLTERWYGAQHTVEPLPQALQEACAAALLQLPVGPHTEQLRFPVLPLPPSPTISGNGTATAVLSSAQPLLEDTSEGTPGAAEPKTGDPTNPLPQQPCQPLQSDLRIGPLYPPAPNWALPVDTSLRRPPLPVLSDNHAVQSPPSALTGTVDQQPAPSALPDGPPQLEGRLERPTLQVDTPGLRLWHQLDTHFAIPKAHVYLHLVTARVYEDPAAWVRARLLARCLDDLLQPEVYASELLGTGYSFTCTETGFLLHLKGFSSVLPRLLRLVLQGLQRLGSEEGLLVSRWGIMADKLRQNLELWRHNNPLQHAEYAAEHFLQHPHWHVNDTLAALLVGKDAHTSTADLKPGAGSQEVGPDSVMQLARTLGAEMHVEMLCYGNLEAGEAHVLAALVQEGLQPCGLPRGGPWPQPSIIRLAAPVGAHTLPESSAVDPDDVRNPEDQGGHQRGPCMFKWEVQNPNPDNTNSALLYACQVGNEHGPGGTRMAVLLSLLVRVASKPCFHALRTTQRLGYVVSLSVLRMRGVLMLQVRVQSPDKEPDLLHTRVHAWLASYRAELALMAAEDLEVFKTSMRAHLLEPPRTLADAAQRPWHAILQRTYAFHRRTEKAQELESVDLQGLLAFYDAHILPPSEAFTQTLALNSVEAADHVTVDLSVGKAAGLVVPSGGLSRVLSCGVQGGRAVAPILQASGIGNVGGATHGMANSAVIHINGGKMQSTKLAQPRYPPRDMHTTSLKINT